MNVYKINTGAWKETHDATIRSCLNSNFEGESEKTDMPALLKGWIGKLNLAVAVVYWRLLSWWSGMG